MFRNYLANDKFESWNKNTEKKNIKNTGQDKVTATEHYPIHWEKSFGKITVLSDKATTDCKNPKIIIIWSKSYN